MMMKKTFLMKVGIFIQFIYFHHKEIYKVQSHLMNMTEYSIIYDGGDASKGKRQE